MLTLSIDQSILHQVSITEYSNMNPNIIESYTGCCVNVGRIVRRIIRYAPSRALDGLNAVIILDADPHDRGFARYRKETREIEIYAHAIVEWQPWILKRTYLFPYLSIGLALGHEIDHHVNRDNEAIDPEQSAETNAFRYIYPSFGLFKPVAKIISILARTLGGRRQSAT